MLDKIIPCDELSHAIVSHHEWRTSCCNRAEDNCIPKDSLALEKVILLDYVYESTGAASNAGYHRRPSRSSDVWSTYLVAIGEGTDIFSSSIDIVSTEVNRHVTLPSKNSTRQFTG